jgi:hypothetical protein
VLSGGGEDLAGATTQDRVAVVGVLPVAVGVVDDQLQGPARAGSSALIGRLPRLMSTLALIG